MQFQQTTQEIETKDEQENIYDYFRVIHWTQDGEKIEIPRAEAAQEGQLCELGGNIIFIG